MSKPPKGIYVLFDPRTRQDWESMLVRLEEEAGVRMFQLRAKGADFDELIAWGRQARMLLRCALLVINDDPQVALKVGADGIHVGPDDLWPDRVRKMVGPRMLIGASGDSGARMLDLRIEQADYFGVGTFRATTTKPDAGRALGMGGVARAAALTDKPIYIIGGVRPGDVATLKVMGIQGIAVYSGIWAAEDPVAAAAEYMRAWQT